MAAFFAVSLSGFSVMSQSAPSEEYRRYLDEHFPFIGPNEDPPGRSVENDTLRGTRVWQGKQGWRTRHGEAVVRRSFGRPSDVTNIRYPDGSRADANYTLDYGFRRRGGGDKLWIYGRIDITPEEIGRAHV